MIKCPQNLEISYADEMKSGIVAAFSDGGSIAIDMTETHRASLSCIQVIVATHAQAAETHTPLTITASEAMVAIMRHLGLYHILNQKEDT